MGHFKQVGTAAAINGSVEYIISRLAGLRSGDSATHEICTTLTVRMLTSNLGHRLPRLEFGEAKMLADFLRPENKEEVAYQLEYLRNYDPTTYSRLVRSWSGQTGMVRQYMRCIGAIYSVLYIAGDSLAGDAAA